MRPQDYEISIRPLSDEDGGGFLATVPELPGCMSDGETRAEALANVEDVIVTWIHCARKAGEPIPEPRLHRAALGSGFRRGVGLELHYYPETDSLYIELKAGPGSETREVAPGVNADFAADGTIVGLDIEGASRLDLGTLEAIDVPLNALKAAE